MLKPAVGVRYLLEKQDSGFREEQLLQKFLLSHQSDRYFPSLTSWEPDQVEAALAALFPTLDLTNSSFGANITNFVLSNANVRDPRSSPMFKTSELYGLDLRYRFSGNALLLSQQANKTGVALTQDVPTTTKLSRFVVRRSNAQPTITVEGDPLRYIFTEVATPLSGISVQDDDYGLLTLNLILREGELFVNATAWYEYGPVYRRRMPPRKLYKTQINDLSYSALQYTMTGSAKQLNAALSNMTLTVSTETDEDKWSQRPIQDLPVTIVVEDGEDHLVETVVLFVVSSLEHGPLRLSANNVTSETDAIVTRSQTASEPKAARADVWQQLGPVCDFAGDRGGDFFQRDTEYRVQLSSDACTKFMLRQATRSLESIATSLASIPVIEQETDNRNEANLEAAMELVDKNVDPSFPTSPLRPKGGNLFQFRVPSLAALNRVLRQEVLIKPCRCAVRSCLQTIELSLRSLILRKNSSTSLYDQKYAAAQQGGQEFLDARLSCDYYVDLEPTLQVYAAKVLSMRSGDSLDISKAFIFHGMATVESNVTDLSLNITTESGVFLGKTYYLASSVEELSQGFTRLVTRERAAHFSEKPQILIRFFRNVSCTCTIIMLLHTRTGCVDVARRTKSGEFLWKSYGHRGNSPESGVTQVSHPRRPTMSARRGENAP